MNNYNITNTNTTNGNTLFNKVKHNISIAFTNMNGSYNVSGIGYDDNFNYDMNNTYLYNSNTTDTTNTNKPYEVTLGNK
ncbi:hypothetical protein EHP00_2443 [Ecytonucleospora hepatopenaei]|uniref:Uncharacterized protein n=1 Tax=Ecytonucleospora hepatopenaei TaxID=646526 RepID=A0A1W0E2W0_9MICR|nr:hypothetical protein EHP00_2443 [Ecytonucleospora hepatopenaei]